LCVRASRNAEKKSSLPGAVEHFANFRDGVAIAILVKGGLRPA